MIMITSRSCPKASRPEGLAVRPLIGHISLFPPLLPLQTLVGRSSLLLLDTWGDVVFGLPLCIGDKSKKMKEPKPHLWNVFYTAPSTEESTDGEAENGGNLGDDADSNLEKRCYMLESLILERRSVVLLLVLLLSYVILRLASLDSETV